MFEVIIKNRITQEITNKARLATVKEAHIWIAKQKNKKKIMDLLPARECPKTSNYHQILWIEDFEKEISPEILNSPIYEIDSEGNYMLDANGMLILTGETETIPAKFETYVRLKAEYEISPIIDLSKDYDWLLEQCYKKRQTEYPTIKELTVAMWEKDDIVITELETKRQAVKLKYPKPVEQI